MSIKVKLTLIPRVQPINIELEKGIALIDLQEKYQEELPYDILLAKVNNKFEELTFTLEEDCHVELLDMRNQEGNLTYQRSAVMIYLKAIQDVLGKGVTAVVENSLSKGLFSIIKTKEHISDEDLLQIENRMKEIVAEDIKFERKIADKEEALKWMSEDRLSEKEKLLKNAPGLKQVKFYEMGDIKDFFYGLMVPSTKYIKRFELVRYRRGIILRFPHPKDPNVIPPFVDEAKLYNAFAEIKSWGKLMNISYVGDMNEMVENGDYKEVIQISEALHDKKIGHVADMITKNKKRVILIAGPSSSGKTTFAKRLSIHLRVNGLDPIYLSTDDYFLERKNTPLDKNGEPNYEDIEAIETELFNSNINDLLLGKEADLPSFDFLKGSKKFGVRKVKGNSSNVYVIEGIHGLNGLMTKGIKDHEKFKIYISPLTQLSIDEHNRIPTTDARMLRRMIRDNRSRGHSAQNTIKQWPKVRAGEDKNIFPYNGEADVFFNSVHIYELNVLKKYAEPLLLAIKEDEPEYADAIRLLKFLRFFRIIEDDSVIGNNSIIREFIGGSIYV